MRKAFIVLTGILFTLLFATCTQFTADIDDYLSRWSSEAFIQSSTIDKKTYNDANGIVNVASADKVTITLKVQNPKSFRFVMPSASETRKIVEFAHFAGPKPEANIDYKLTQPSADTLKLVYTKSFLEKAEWGEKDISSTITLHATDGRPFKQAYTLKLKANTPPPKPGYAVAKTKGTSADYVLCITVPDMDKTAGGGLLHKDLACIEVNGTPYTFSVNEAQTAFTKPEDPVFITHSDVEKLSNQPNDAIPTDSSWVLYYQTGVKVELGAAKKDYTIKLIDKKGLASDIVNASTKPNKPETEIVRITKGEKIPGSGSGSSDTDPIIIGTDGDKAEIRIASATANTTVHCTRTDTGTSIPYDGNPVTVPLPLNGGNEKQYKLEYYTDGTGFAATPVKTIYYKVVKKYTVTFSVTGGNGTIQANTGTPVPSGTVSVLHGGTVTFTAHPNTGYEVDSWSSNVMVDTSDNKKATLSNVTGNGIIVTVKFKKKVYTVNFSVESVDDKAGGKIKADSGSFVESGSTSVEYGGSVGFTADPTNIDWKVAEWSSNVTPSSDKKKATLSNVTAATTVTVKFYQSTLKNPATWKDLARAVKSAPDNAVITINGEIQATDVANNESRIKVKKNLTIKGENNAVLNAVGKRGIFDVYRTFTLQDITLKNSALPSEYSGGGGVYVDSNGKFIMKGSSVITECSAVKSGGGVYVGGGTFEMHDSSAITGCTASKGGGVYASSGTFKMQDSAVVTPSTGSEQYTAGKNDVYLESRKTITVDSTLTGTDPVARITPREYTADHLYLTGSDVSSQHLKFTVTPQKVTENSENWNVFWYIAADGTLKAEVENSSLLQEVISGRPNDTPFIIKLGNIDDLQTVQIPGHKKIMLKADRKVTLQCLSKSNDYKHLQVQEYASLTLEGKITLQGTDYGSNTQYALFVERGGKAEIKDGVTITGFKNGNIGPVVSDGELTMSGGEISGNKAKNGGGVYIHATWRSFKMTGGTIKGNLATEHGGGVYVDGSHNGGYPIRGQFWLEGGTIEENTADKGGGVYSQGEFTMSGGTITKNTATNNGKAIMLNYYFHWQGGEIKDNRGKGSVVGDSGGNFSNDTNPRKEPS